MGDRRFVLSPRRKRPPPREPAACSQSVSAFWPLTVSILVDVYLTERKSTHTLRTFAHARDCARHKSRRRTAATRSRARHGSGPCQRGRTAMMLRDRRPPRVSSRNSSHRQPPLSQGLQLFAQEKAISRKYQMPVRTCGAVHERRNTIFSARQWTNC